jgi:hypothetical protein
MAKSKHIILPNTRRLWERGYSLSLYSRSYDFDTQKQDFSDLGRAVHEYKWFKQLSLARRQELVQLCGAAISTTLKLDEEIKEIRFNSCIGVLPNNTSGHSLPRDLAKELSTQYEWLQDDSNCLIKVKQVPQIKSLGKYELRKEALNNAYEVDPSYDFSGVEGILIIDDVYESGSTLREFCRTLHRALPDIPRYVLTLTHLKSVWSEQR